MSIKNLSKLEDNGTLAEVELVKIGLNGKGTRFNLVVVDDVHAIDTVTDQYELITNSMILDSIDRAASIVGMPSLSVSTGYLNTDNGNSRIALTIEDGGITVPGDESKTMKELLISNNYAGRGRFGVEGGLLRIVCSNGMTIFDAVASEDKIHIGVEDLDEWALETLSVFNGKADIFKTLTEIAAASDWSPTRSGEALVATAPKRYQVRLTEALKDNTHAIGYNAWAAMQAITEVSTHDMKNTVTARRWSDKAIETVLSDIGSTWKAVEAQAETV